MIDNSQEAAIGNKAARDSLAHEQKLSVVQNIKASSPVRTGLMNPNFVYVPAIQTDIRVRFDVIRAAVKQEKR